MNIYQRAGQFWAVLAYAASKSHIITYTELSNATGSARFGKEMSYSLGEIKAYCEKRKWPPLTALVVSEKTGEPAYEFDNWSASLQDVFRHPWSRAQGKRFEKVLERRRSKRA